MKDEPQGRFVLKYVGKSIGGKRYHLYRDCGMLGYAHTPEEKAALLQVSDEMIALLEMRVCEPCNIRANSLDYTDVIFERAKRFSMAEQGAAGTKHEGDFEQHAWAFTEDLVEALENQGYKIRKVRNP